MKIDYIRQLRRALLHNLTMNIWPL